MTRHLRRLPRPSPSQTPIQRACTHLGEAFHAAREDDRALAAFVEITIFRIAAEAARLIDREPRP